MANIIITPSTPVVTGTDGDDRFYFQGFTGTEDGVTVDGGAGADFFSEMPVPALLRGGPGRDTFLLDMGDAAATLIGPLSDWVNDTIRGFDPGRDMLVLEGVQLSLQDVTLRRTPISDTFGGSLQVAYRPDPETTWSSFTFSGLSPDPYLPSYSMWFLSVSVVGEDTHVTLSAEPQPITATGGPGNDTLTGQAANDSLTGMGGNDLLIGGGGDDTLTGGPGNDVYRIAHTGNTIVETADGGIDTIDYLSIHHDAPLPAHVENITLRPDDTLFPPWHDWEIIATGNELDNRMVANSRLPASFDGGAGDDTLIGRGPDTLRGEEGNDRLEALQPSGSLLDGGAGADELIGNGGADTLIGGPAQDDLADRAYGMGGDDSLDGGGGNDRLYGGTGGDTILGGFGSDTLAGQQGDDVLNGGALADLLFGNDGDDFLTGGFGSDRLNGGAGADIFWHLGVAGHGSDWVQDYSHAQGDRLEFGGAAGPAQFQVNFANTAGAGDAATDEAFVIYRPTGQILWALVDGAGEGSIELQIGGQVVDLIA